MRILNIGGHLILAAALACTSACAAISGANGGVGSGSATSPPVASVGDRVVVEGGRALILANLAYQTVGTAAAIGMERGVITGETKNRVKAASARVVDALDKGERAMLAGDKALSAAQAFGALDALCALHATLAAACKLAR